MDWHPLIVLPRVGSGLAFDLCNFGLKCAGGSFSDMNVLGCSDDRDRVDIIDGSLVDSCI